MLKFKLLTLNILIYAVYVNAQTDNFEPVIQPEIIIGYTLGEGFIWGVELSALMSELTINSQTMKVGASISYFWTLMNDKSTHRIIAVNGLVETNYAECKLGFGQVRYKWGYGLRNKNRAFGLMFDASGTYPPQSPWLGVRTFIFRNKDWAWKKTSPYLMFYGYMRTAGFTFK